MYPFYIDKPPAEPRTPSNQSTAKVVKMPKPSQSETPSVQSKCMNSKEFQATINTMLYPIVIAAENLEKRFQQLEKESQSKTKQIKELTALVDRLHFGITGLQSQYNALRQHLKIDKPHHPSSWASRPNDVFGHSPEGYGHGNWSTQSRPTMPPHPSYFDTWAPPVQDASYGWGSSGKSLFAHPGQTSPGPVIKPSDLPPYPGLVVKPEDLSICNEVVTCCVGSNGELYSLTKDTIIAHVVSWEERQSYNIQMNWGQQHGAWAVVKESDWQDVPAGTLIHSRSNDVNGLIVRYPDRTYDFKIINL